MAINQLDKEIGERITLLIQELNSQGKMNYGEFSSALGLDPSHFSRIRKGEAGLPKEGLIAISSKFGADINWLLTGSGNMFKEKSGPSQEPDLNLLTQIRDQISLYLNLHKPSISAEVPIEENVNQGAAFSAIVRGKSRKSDKQ